MVLAVATIESDDEVDFAHSDDEAEPLACELDGVADARSASSWDLVQSALGNDASADAHATSTIIEELLAKLRFPAAKSTARAKAADAGDQVREFSVKMTKRARHDDADPPPAPEPSAEEAEGTEDTRDEQAVLAGFFDEVHAVADPPTRHAVLSAAPEPAAVRAVESLGIRRADRGAGAHDPARARGPRRVRLRGDGLGQDRRVPAAIPRATASPPGARARRRRHHVSPRGDPSSSSVPHASDEANRRRE